MANKLIFLYFASVILVSAVLVITRKNLIQSLLLMLLLFFHVAGIFIILHAEFIAGAFLLVFGVAGTMLFLGVLLFAFQEEKTKVLMHASWPWMAGVGFLVAMELIIVMAQGGWAAYSGESMKSVAGGLKTLGELLFEKNLVSVEIIAILFLIGLVGIVMLLKKEKESS